MEDQSFDVGAGEVHAEEKPSLAIMRSRRVFLATTIGQTALMATTGAFLYLYVFFHLLGNLQVYLGREQINAYAIFLHSHYAMLWAARTLLLAVVLLHITIGANLWWLGRHAARPISYFMKKDVPPAY